MNAIISVFPETNLSSGHLGLRKIAEKHHRKIELLDPGEFVMFLNRRQTAFKLYANNNTIVHYKHPRGRISLEAVKFFPAVFQAGKFSYDAALEKVLNRKLKI